MQGGGTEDFTQEQQGGGKGKKVLAVDTEAWACTSL